MRFTGNRIKLVLAITALFISRSNPRSAGILTGNTVERSHNAVIADIYGKLPLSFEANKGQMNKGQMDDDVKFVSRGHGYGLFLKADESKLTPSET